MKCVIHCVFKLCLVFSLTDLWFAKHQETCGGTFHKVSEPEPKIKLKKPKTLHAVENVPKITDFWNSKDTFSNEWPNTPRNPAGGYTKMNGGGTIVMKPTTQNRGSSITINDGTPKKLNSNATRRAAAGGNLNNVIGFRDLNSSGKCILHMPEFVQQNPCLYSSKSIRVHIKSISKTLFYCQF